MKYKSNLISNERDKREGTLFISEAIIQTKPDKTKQKPLL